MCLLFSCIVDRKSEMLGGKRGEREACSHTFERDESTCVEDEGGCGEEEKRRNSHHSSHVNDADDAPHHHDRMYGREML